MNDAPIFEEEISDERTTARVTVDVADEGMYATLALEPNEGELRQIVLRLDADVTELLIGMLRDALAEMYVLEAPAVAS